MTFRRRLFLNEVVIQYVILAFLIMPPCKKSCGLSFAVPFFHIIKDTVPSSRTCVYDHINWNLEQVQYPALSGLSQSSLTLVRSGKAKTGFQFKVQKWTMLHVSSTSLARKSNFDTCFKTYLNSRRSSDHGFDSSSDCKEKGAWGGDNIPEVVQCAISMRSSAYVVQGSTLPQFLDQWRNITCNRFVLSMVKD